MTADEREALEKIAVDTYDQGVIAGLRMAVVLMRVAPTLKAGIEAVEHLADNPPDMS